MYNRQKDRKNGKPRLERVWIFSRVILPTHLGQGCSDFIPCIGLEYLLVTLQFGAKWLGEVLKIMPVNIGDWYNEDQDSGIKIVCSKLFQISLSSKKQQKLVKSLSKKLKFSKENEEISRKKMNCSPALVGSIIMITATSIY